MLHYKLSLCKYESGVIILWKDMIWLKIYGNHWREFSKSLPSIDLWLIYPNLTSIKQFKVSLANFDIKSKLQGLRHFHLQVTWLLHIFDHVIQISWVFLYTCKCVLDTHKLHPLYLQPPSSFLFVSVERERQTEILPHMSLWLDASQLNLVRVIWVQYP